MCEPNNSAPPDSPELLVQGKMAPSLYQGKHLLLHGDPAKTLEYLAIPIIITPGCPQSDNSNLSRTSLGAEIQFLSQEESQDLTKVLAEAKEHSLDQTLKILRLGNSEYQNG